MTATVTEPVYLGRYESGTPQFEEVRRTRLGGSEIAAVIGLHPYESHLSLWFRKRGWAQPQPDNDLMEWGRRLEPLVFDRFTETRMNEAHWVYSPGSYVHPEREWQMASPDAVGKIFPEGSSLIASVDSMVPSGEIVEVKTVQSELDWGEPGTNQIPIHYRCQVLHNMDVLGASRCWLPVLIRGAFYREYLVEMDDQAEADLTILREAGAKFIQSLVDDEPPSIDGHDATYRAIRERHPEIEDGDVVIPGDLADAYLVETIAERMAKEERHRLAGEIMNLMGTSRNALRETGNEDDPTERFAFRKPASNPDRTPYLMADPAVIRAMRPTPTIHGAS